MTLETATAASAGTWKLGDREVNRLGFGTMRLTGNGMNGNSDGAPIDRDRAVSLLRRAVDLGVGHHPVAHQQQRLVGMTLGVVLQQVVIDDLAGFGADGH